jgi:hypothetical protein
MTLRSKTLLLASVVLAAAFVILNLPHAPTATVAADGPNTTVVKHYAPASAIDRIVPADTLDAGTRWAPLTSDGQ